MKKQQTCDHIWSELVSLSNDNEQHAQGHKEYNIDQRCVHCHLKITLHLTQAKEQTKD